MSSPMPNKDRIQTRREAGCDEEDNNHEILKPELNLRLDNIENSSNSNCTQKTSNSSSVSTVRVDLDRVRCLQLSGEYSVNLPPISTTSSDSIIYWMSRDQRVNDNWALLYAQDMAIKHNKQFHVVFCLVKQFLDGTERAFQFLLQGLELVEEELRKKNIPFHLLLGRSTETLPEFVKNNKVGAIITDFSPLKPAKAWKLDLLKELLRQGLHSVPVYIVDAHNIVPVWIASNKQEFAARTIRSKIHFHLNRYLTPYPSVPHQTHSNIHLSIIPTDYNAAEQSLEIDRTVKLPSNNRFKPGEQSAKAELQSFINIRLKHYAKLRNNPNQDCQSDLSPYLHFGHISAATIVMSLSSYKTVYPASVAALIEELVVRRELSDNYCYYNENYDNFDGAAQWAKLTLNQHKLDKREFEFSLGELEAAVTYDDLWNAAQLQLVSTGKMHGFLRMYWCKKILQWTKSVEQAIIFSNYLNDKYSLDGRDPNGYVGIQWCITGLHDQGFGERSIFGKIRYMNYEGCKRKFDINRFVNQFPDSIIDSDGYKQNQIRARELDRYRIQHNELLDESRGNQNQLLTESRIAESKDHDCKTSRSSQQNRQHVAQNNQRKIDSFTVKQEDIKYQTERISDTRIKNHRNSNNQSNSSNHNCASSYRDNCEDEDSMNVDLNGNYNIRNPRDNDSNNYNSINNCSTTSKRQRL